MRKFSVQKVLNSFPKKLVIGACDAGSCHVGDE